MNPAISNTEKPAFTPQEVMGILNLGRNTVYALLASGELRGKRVGSEKWLIPRAEIDRWLNSQA